MHWTDVTDSQTDCYTAAMTNPDPGVTVSREDPLLDALVALTRLHHRPFSAESLIAGLPLESGKLTAALFIRAAERAGFSARRVNRAIGEIPTEVLPVALINNDGSTVILHRVDHDLASVSDPADVSREALCPIDKLTAEYSGQCFYFKARADHDAAEDTTSEHWFWSTIRRSRGIYLEVLVASFLVNLFALVTPLFIMNVYDRVVPNHATDTLWVLASGVFIVFAFDLVVRSLRGYFIDVAGKRADILLSSATFARVMDIRMQAKPARVGSFANNLQEFDTFREFFTSTTLITVIDLPFVILFILLIFGIGGISLAAIPLIAIPAIVIASLVVQAPLQETVQQTFAESARKHALLIESLTGIEGLKSARAEGEIQRRWETHNSRLAGLSLRARTLSLGTVNFAQVIQHLTTIGVVIAGVYLIMKAELTVGGLIACTILAGRCVAPMGQVASILTRLHHSRSAYRAINQLMSLPVERPAGRKFVHRPNLDGDVTFEQVDFRYPEQQEKALAGLSFQIRAGERVGIIGRMGSGKSTVGRLLMGFYTPEAGSLRLSGTDINQLDPVDIRRNISYVPQDITLLSGTLRENIALGAPLATDEQIIQAAELAGLKDYINHHPLGFDLPVGERGCNLSGGQRQAVTIARAFLVPAPLILLDEPTNFMDNTAESHFREALAQILENRTLILVTHKASLLPLVDRLIVINEGTVVADGPRNDIIKALSGATA